MCGTRNLALTVLQQLETDLIKSGGDKLQLGFFFLRPPLLRVSAETIKDELQPAGKVLQPILIDRARLSVPLSSHIN